MTEAALRSAIEGPARQAGLRLEAGLLEVLVSEVGASRARSRTSPTRCARPGSAARAVT